MDPSHPPGGVMVHGTFPWHIFGPLRIKSVVAEYANPFYHSFPTPFLDVVQLENPIKTKVQKVCHEELRQL